MKIAIRTIARHLSLSGLAGLLLAGCSEPDTITR
jgi:hypothetical protein